MTTSAYHLLAVEKQKREGHTLMVPLIVGILNLVCCSYWEVFLRKEPGRLHLFLFSQAAFVIALSAGQFFTTSIDILSRTKVFPVTSSDRLRFAVVADVRRPVVLAVISSAALFLIIFFRHDALQAVLAPLMYITFALATVVMFVTLMLIMKRTAVPVVGLLSVLGVFALITFFAAMMFNVDLVLVLNPLVIATVNGIQAAGRGDIIGICESAAALGAAGSLTVLIGRRLA